MNYNNGDRISQKYKSEIREIRAKQGRMFVAMAEECLRRAADWLYLRRLLDEFDRLA